MAARGSYWGSYEIIHKLREAGKVILSVINVSVRNVLKAAGRDLLKLFRINTGKYAGQLTKRALDGMNHSAATASSTEKTLFAANVALGRQALTGKQQDIIAKIKNKILSLTEGRGELMKAGMTATTIASVLPFLEDEDAQTEYNVLTGQEVPKGGIRRDIEARANRFFDSKDAERVPDYITDYRAELKTDPYRDDKRSLRSRVPEYDVSTLRAVPVRTTRKSPEELAKEAETEAARQYFRESNRRRDMFGATEFSKARKAAERAAIKEASPKFTSA